MGHAVAVQVADLLAADREGELAAAAGPGLTPGQEVTSVRDLLAVLSCAVSYKFK